MSIYPEKIIKEILDQLEVKTVLETISYRTDTIQEIGDVIKCFCPIHKEQVFRTLIINPKDKSYRCSYSLCGGNKGGDLLSLYALSRGLDYDQGVTQIVKDLNLEIELPTTQEFIDKTVEVAENYLELGVLDEAETGFSKVAEIQPNNIDAQKGLLEIYTIQKNEDRILQQLKVVVRLLLEMREYENALLYCNQLIERIPNSKEAHYWMVDCYLGKEDYQASLGEYMNLADLHESDGEFEDALAIYRKIENLGLDLIDIYPHIISVLVASNRSQEAIQETIKRAEHFKTTKEYDKTLDSYKYILELDNSRNDIRKQYIHLSLEIGLSEERIEECLRLVEDLLFQHALGEALDSLNALLKATPSNTKILEKLINVYLDQGKLEEATALRLRLSDLHETAGHLDDALIPLNAIMGYKPDFIKALSRLASIYCKKQEFPLATDTYKKIMEIHQEKNNLLEAIAIYEKIIEINPDEVSFKEEQIDLYILADKIEEAFAKSQDLIDDLESKKNYDLVIDKIRFALALKQDADILIVRLADLLSRLKRMNEARDEYFHAYEVLRNNKKMDLASSQLMKCLDINPNDQKALFSLADTFVEIGDVHKALNHYRKLSSLLLEEGNLEEGEKVLQKIISLQPDDINTHILLVTIYQQLGYENEIAETYEKLSQLYLDKEAYNKVIEVCQSILEIRPDNIPAHEKLIQVYEHTNRRKEAIQLWFKLADIHDRSGDLAKEEETYKAILKADNANVDARRNYIFLLTRTGQKQPAYKEARILSDQYITRRQPELAVELYNKLLETDPEELPLHLHLLELLKKSNQVPQIIAQTRRLIALYAERKQLATVADYYGQLIKYEPENVEFRSSFIETLLLLDRKEDATGQAIGLAELHTQHGQLEDAEKVYQKILAMEPQDQEVYRKLIALNRSRGTLDKAIELINHLSLIQYKKGETPQAVGTLRDIFQFDAMNIETHRRIIEIYKEQQQIDSAVGEYLELYDIHYNTGDIEQAISTLKEAIEVNPEDTQLRKKLVIVHIQRDDIEEASRESFRICDIHAKAQHYQEVLNTLAEILEHDPGNIQAKKRRAETFALMGDDKKALAEFMKLSSELDSKFFTAAPSSPVKETAAESTIPELPIVEDYTFESFVVDTRNNFAYATSLAVAKAPAQNYNPLFLCSDVGLGKTHLIHAIANFIKKHQPEIKILYTNSEEFTTQLIDAIQNNTINQFRTRHKNTQVLLLDDVQFLAGKERAQEEFFHVFNTLFQSKKQIVITSDRPPRDIAHLEKRLKSRFGAGIIVDIQPPDPLTRAAILKKERDHIPDVDISDNIINLIAEKVETNIRDLKGAFNQIIGRQRITNQPITEEMVHQVLDNLFAKV